jgi:hypothetical protein
MFVLLGPVFGFRNGGFYHPCLRGYKRGIGSPVREFRGFKVIYESVP